MNELIASILSVNLLPVASKYDNISKALNTSLLAIKNYNFIAINKITQNWF